MLWVGAYYKDSLLRAVSFAFALFAPRNDLALVTNFLC